VRLGSALRGSLILALALHIHHSFHGPPIDYAGLAAASAASWIGVPGPGEPVLIAAGIFAARHELDLASVLLVAWAGAATGGIAGWAIGIKAGRALVTAPGPLLALRTAAVARGDEVFDRFPVVAILLTPSWIAGIHRVRSAVYMLTNAAGAAAWAVGIGLGAYFIGPPVVELVSDIGVATGVAFGLLVAAGITTGVLRRRRRRRPQL
jgi:membrane protein DedA with SNARE-associated domain